MFVQWRPYADDALRGVHSSQAGSSVPLRAKGGWAPFPTYSTTQMWAQ